MNYSTGFLEYRPGVVDDSYFPSLRTVAPRAMTVAEERFDSCVFAVTSRPVEMSLRSMLFRQEATAERRFRCRARRFPRLPVALGRPLSAFLLRR